MFRTPLRKFNALAGAVSEVVELCSSRPSAANRFYIDDIGRMYREDSFNALIIDDSADGESFVRSAASSGNDCSAEYLDTSLVSFFDFTMHINHIAYFEVRKLRF